MHRIVVDEKKWIDEPRFLHALNFCMLLPGPEATEARDLCRLAAAWRARRARRRHPVRAAGRPRDAGLEPALRLRARARAGRRRAVRHQGRGAGDRGRGADPHRQPRAQDAVAGRAGGAGLRRHLFFGAAVSADRRGGGAHRLSGRAARAGSARAVAAGAAASPTDPADAGGNSLSRWRSGLRCGGRRSRSPRCCSAPITCWSRSACSSPSSRW